MPCSAGGLQARPVAPKYRDGVAGNVVWTATHRFVVLAMHVAYQGDGEVQDEERVALVDACMRIGTEADVPEDDMIAMVEDACEAYEQAREDGTEQDIVEDAITSLGGLFKRPVLQSLAHELREIALAHGGVHEDEHAVLMDVCRAWGIESVASMD